MGGCRKCQRFLKSFLGMSEMSEMMSEMSEVMSEMSEVMSEMSEMISEVGNSEKDGVLPSFSSFL